MHIVSVRSYEKSKTQKPKTGIFSILLSWLWSLTGSLFPALFIYTITSLGSPALLISESRVQCGYLDIFGGFYSKTVRGDCRWYGFREIQIIPTEINTILEAH